MVDGFEQLAGWELVFSEKSGGVHTSFSAWVKCSCSSLCFLVKMCRAFAILPKDAYWNLVRSTKALLYTCISFSRTVDSTRIANHDYEKWVVTNERETRTAHSWLHHSRKSQETEPWMKLVLGVRGTSASDLCWPWNRLSAWPWLEVSESRAIA